MDCVGQSSENGELSRKGPLWRRAVMLWSKNKKNVRSWLLVVFLVGIFGSQVVARECWGVPNPADLREAEEKAKGRGEEAISDAEKLGEITLGDLPPNFMGQANPGAAVGNVLSDTIKEAGNFLPSQCFDWKPLPGCCCGQLGLCFFPAYEYRWPMTRYEITRQPFQSDYWPSPAMKLFQKITLEPAVALLVKLDFSTVVLSLLRQGFKVPKPSVALDFIKSLVNVSFQKVPKPEDNKARGGGLQGDGTTQTSVHAYPSPLRFPPLSHAFEPLTLFGAVKSHIADGFDAMPLPDFTEGPRLSPFARSPGRSAFISKVKALAEMWSRHLADPRACVRFIMDEWKKHDREDGPTVGMVPGLINAGSGDVEPDKHPCLRFGNIKWFPFDFHLNVSSEPMAAWVSMIKMAKLMRSTREKGLWSDIYDLKDDKAQYLRGDGLTGSSFRCTDIEKPYEEFGDANKLEQPAEPIMITHWKRYSGCPPSWNMYGSCPRGKINRQSAFNPEVKNSTRTP